MVFSQERLELTVVLIKKDLVPTYQEAVAQIKQLYPQSNLLAISIYDEGSLLALKEVLNPQQIGLFIGSSGAGKSSLINQLQSDYVAKVNAVKADHKGKHTTTSSLLIYFPEIDYYVIDTPGFKGIDTHHEIDRDILFAPIEDLAKSCKFSNCQHDTEPKCAVKAALEAGQLDHALFDRYRYQLGKMDLLSKRRKSWRL
ncbi:ribosome small subunit-dependent GTPase A [Streptococcus rupicaprae]|uniref:ribosome small subunit-dependent GTPase A n=1 Tax=Streptococcus rupicaprae TaxID=759619 RepID=UPI003396C3E0